MSSASEAQGGAPPKLPLDDAIRRSYSIYFRTFGDVLRACWLWLVIIIPVTAITSWLQLSWMNQVMAQVNPGAPPQKLSLPLSLPAAKLWVLFFGVSLLFMAASFSIAVAWHRRVVLDEQPRLSASNVVSGSFWRYIAVGIALCLCVIVPAFLGVLILVFVASPLVSHDTPGGLNVVFGALIAVFTVVLYVAGIVAMLRLSLLLPARATGDLSLTFTETWKRTRGNTWRLLWGIVACTLPPALTIQIAFFAFFGLPLSSVGLFAHPEGFAGHSFSLSLFLLAVIAKACDLLIAPFWAGFLSLAYLHFFGRQPDQGLQ